MEASGSVAMSDGERLHQVLAQLGHFVGLTIVLGFGGGLAAVFGNRKLAGVFWMMLGAGSVGAAFSRSTKETLRLDRLHPLTHEEIAFLLAHLPFLLLGLMMLLMKERK